MGAGQRQTWLEDRLDALFAYRMPQQLAVLLYKNLLVAWRSRRATLIRLLAPLMFLLLALVMQAALDASIAVEGRYRPIFDAVRQPVQQIPDCSSDLYIHDRPCVTLVFTPNTSSVVRGIIERVRTGNAPEIPSNKVLGFATRAEAEAYMAGHAATTLGAVHFVEAAGGGLKYLLQSSSTPKLFKSYVQDPQLFWHTPVMSAVSREVARQALLDAGRPGDAEGLAWAPSLARFPHPEMASLSLTGRVIAPCIFAACMFGAVTQMAQIVAEKDAGLRQAMRTMGLMDTSYWGSWVVFDLAFGTLLTLVIILSGMALRFRFFLANDFSLLFALFWLFLAAISGFVYFVTAFVSKPQAAVYVGFLVFLGGWTFQGIVTYGLPYTPSFYFEPSPARRPIHRAIFWLFTAMPWNPLAKAILDMAAATNTRAHPGIRWGQRDAYCVAGARGGGAPPHDPLAVFYNADCVFPVGSCLGALALQFVGYTLLGVWLDNVLPNALGARRSPLFFLRRAFWRPRRADQGEALARLVAEAEARMAADKKADAAGVRAVSGAGGPDEDEDVGEESARIKRSLGQRVGGLVRVDGGGGAAARRPRASASSGGVRHRHSSGVSSGGGSGGSGGAAMAAAAAQQRHWAAHAAGKSCGGKGEGEGGAEYAVEVFGLQKVFRVGGWARSAPAWLGGRPSARDFWAVKDSWFGIEHGQLFCLLGPNGAGKTTTINCLTGSLPPTAGDALIYGESLRGEGGLDRVRPLMGVCPQFDVLWGELSGREHLTIYGHIKGLKFSEVRRESAELLEKVKLTYAGGVRSGSYSGGMKRRLSVAIALLGDPKVVYLDEPTTGMDPISRRHVWDIIQDAKAGRAIVLTTHSMEEADILGDRIAIMARGRLKAIGSSIRLKQKYGAGYTAAVSVLQPAAGDNSADALAGRAEGVREFFLSRLGLLPFDEGRSHLHYLVPRALEARLGGVLAELEGAREAVGASDVQLSLTSLEEVFLTIARKAELAAAEAQGNTAVEVPLPCGGVLHVPLGQDTAANPCDGRVYAVKWAQDDAGRLVVLDVLPLGDGGLPGLGLGAGAGGASAAAARGARAGQRRRSRAGGDVPRERSFGQLLAAAVGALLGGRSADSSGHSSSTSGAAAGSLAGGGSAVAARLRYLSSGGGTAAELGERGYAGAPPRGGAR